MVAPTSLHRLSASARGLGRFGCDLARCLHGPLRRTNDASHAAPLGSRGIIGAALLGLERAHRPATHSRDPMIDGCIPP
jgi:hypothetical protein